MHRACADTAPRMAETRYHNRCLRQQESSPTWFPFAPRGRNSTSVYMGTGSRRHDTESTRIPSY
jgi:hypothetical protein